MSKWILKPALRGSFDILSSRMRARRYSPLHQKQCRAAPPRVLAGHSTKNISMAKDSQLGTSGLSGLPDSSLLGPALYRYPDTGNTQPQSPLRGTRRWRNVYCFSTCRHRQCNIERGWRADESRAIRHQIIKALEQLIPDGGARMALVDVTFISSFRPAMGGAESLGLSNDIVRQLAF